VAASTLLVDGAQTIHKIYMTAAGLFSLFFLSHIYEGDGSDC